LVVNENGPQVSESYERYSLTVFVEAGVRPAPVVEVVLVEIKSYRTAPRLTSLDYSL